MKSISLSLVKAQKNGLVVINLGHLFFKVPGRRNEIFVFFGIKIRAQLYLEHSFTACEAAQPATH